MTPQELIQRASTATDIPVPAITGSGRKREIVMVRHFLMWHMRRNLRMTLGSVGEVFDRDHTTVIHAITMVHNYIQTDDELYMPIHEMLNRKLFQPIRRGGYCNECRMEISRGGI